VQTQEDLKEIEDTSRRQLGLRFDLTVPATRYAIEHFSDLVFPFRRYQIQKVYRGERSQDGKFNEFYQADIDIFGNDSIPISADVEILTTINYVLDDLDIG
jgi:histidyl-tRNA synthetase